MKNIVKMLVIIAFTAIIGVSVISCPEPNQTPVSSDYFFGNLNQTAGSVTAVTITANSGKSPGAVSNIRYNGSITIPQTNGSYAVTFDVAAATGWNSVSGLFAGNLVVGNQTPVASDYSIGNLMQTAGNVIAVVITPNSGKSSGTVSNIRYNGSTTIPQTNGTYSVTFDVDATNGWNAAIGLAAGNLVVNQIPIADDYEIDRLNQTVGSITAVTITPKTDKSTGTITIFYNGSSTLPTTVGTYTVTFNVAATTGWNAATGLAGGILTISYIPSGIVINLSGLNELDLTEQSTQAAVNLNKIFTINGSYSTYHWYLDGILVGTSSSFIFNKSEKNVYQLSVVVTDTNGESRSGRCRVTVVEHPPPLDGNLWADGNITVANGEDWYSFPVINGTTYHVWWNDRSQGDNTKTGIVAVSARYENATSFIFNSHSSNGWNNGRLFTANQAGTVYIRVSPTYMYGTANIGTYSIVISTDTVRPVL